MSDIKPKFQAERVEGNFKRTVMRIDEDVREITNNNGVTRKIVTRKIVPVVEEFTEAYEIYYPQGHSIRVRADDVKTLERLGVLRPAPLVNMETGEIVPDREMMSPKQIVQQKTRQRITGGIETAMGA